jgi:hypothetical protein
MGANKMNQNLVQKIKSLIVPEMARICGEEAVAENINWEEIKIDYAKVFYMDGESIELYFYFNEIRYFFHHDYTFNRGWFSKRLKGDRSPRGAISIKEWGFR